MEAEQFSPHIRRHAQDLLEQTAWVQRSDTQIFWTDYEIESDKNLMTHCSNHRSVMIK